MMKITGLSHLFKWENLQNLWLTKYFFGPLYSCCDQRQLDAIIACQCALARLVYTRSG